LNSASNSRSYDIVRFKIEVGIEEKFTCKMYQNKCDMPISITMRRVSHVLAST